jgi:hypothetical protein
LPFSVKRLAVWACTLALALPAQAEEKVGVTEGNPRGPGGTASPGAVTAPVTAGYVFEQPEVFVAQLLWGLAHGVRLLGLACAEHGDLTAAESWVAWQEREQSQILAAGRVLGRHYFGSEDAPPDIIAAALGLKPALALPAETLDQACTTLPEALTKPRYDLARFREQTLETLRRGVGADPVEILK